MTAGPNAPPDRGFTYPAEYTFKIMGLAADDFAEHARRLVAGAVAEVPAEGVTVRASAGGKYHSVSVTVVLRSEEERVAVYAALKRDARVVYAL
ncbi:MAG TPA: DUF493 domain-containing protein [Anaeromyxobacteraceae bacterium]|nr:DUF493 domain-containing protein [Anaeromyxobacteraceae bacterium]